MKNTQKYKIILLIIIPILSIILLTITIKNHKLTLPENIIKDSFLFIEEIIYKPINWTTKKINNLKTLWNANELYLKNKDKIDDYDILEAKLIESEKTISKLKETLELQNTFESYSKINATIITRNIDSWYQFVTIDKGKKNNIQVGDAVINNKGLIGYVINTSNFTSTIKLLTSNYNNKISVIINEKIYGLIVGYENDYLIIEGISSNSTINIDDKVKTSGLGNNFPSGLIIGTVDNITTDSYDLAKTLLVKPTVDFNDLNYVTVIKKGDL